MSAVEPLVDDTADVEAARALVADALLQLVVEGCLPRERTHVALAALGITTPDLEAARRRRKVRGWQGPRLEQPLKWAPDIDKLTRASHSSAQYKAANPSPGMKRCVRCHEVKPVETFQLKSATSGKPERRSFCPPCFKEYQRERYLSVKKIKMLNEVGLTFIVAAGDDVAHLACIDCLKPINVGDEVYGRATLRHTHCPTG